MPKTIFISHKGDDADAVIAISSLLRGLTAEGAIVNTSQGIKAGAFWFNQVLEYLKNSDYFILLHTDDDTDWSWCMFEAGAFLDVKKASLRKEQTAGTPSEGAPESSTNLFFISLTEKAPGPFQQFQRTPATVAGITKMFRDIFVDGNDPYKQYWWDKNSDSIDQSARRFLSLAFGSERVRTDYPHQHYVRLRIAGTINADTPAPEAQGLDAASSAWKRVGGFGYPPDVFSSATIVEEKGVNQVIGRTPPTNATWGQIVGNQPWSKRLEEEFLQLMYPPQQGQTAPTYGLLEKLITFEGRVYIPLIYKHSVSGTGRVGCKIIFIRQQDRSMPITRFSHLIRELTRLLETSKGQKLNFVARTPALGALAEPELYKTFKEALQNYKGPISMITLSEEPLAKFHVGLEGKTRSDEKSPITSADVDQANEESVKISRSVSQHGLAKDLPFLYLFNSDSGAILVTPSFREEEKDEQVTMYGVSSNDEDAINHAKFLFEHVRDNYVAQVSRNRRLTLDELAKFTGAARNPVPQAPQ